VFPGVKWAGSFPGIRGIEAWSRPQSTADLQAKEVHAVVLQTELVHFSVLNTLFHVSVD